MADQHNANIPSLTDLIVEDIPDIKENLEFHKDAFERIFQAWSDTDNSAAVFSTTPGFNNGSYAIAFPTNQGAAAKFMLGNSSTVTWFYVNTAPPFWKVLAITDTILAVSSSSGTYSVNGGTQAGSWTVSGLTADAHTHTGPSHFHTVSGNTSGGEASYGSPVLAGDSGSGLTHYHTMNFSSSSAGTGNTGAASATGVSSTGAWRPKASVGKLFQLDAA